MTNKATRTATRTEQAEPTDLPGFDNLVELNKDAFKTVDEMSHSVAETFETFGEESLDFLRRRIGEDLAVPQKLIGCWSPQEAMDVYLDFVRTAQKDYLEEADRMARLGRGIAHATMQMMQIEIAPQAAATSKGERAKGA
jgi:hypothetical protein